MVEICIISGRAPVAQMDRAIASGAIGREFESLRAHQILPSLPIIGNQLCTLHTSDQASIVTVASSG